MSIDPMFLDFGLNLTKQYIAGRQVDVQNAGIALNNELAQIAGAEQQGFNAVNYSQSLEELNNQSLSIAVQQMDAEAEARLASAAYGVTEEAYTLNIAREAGQSQAEIDQAKDFATINHKQQRKSLQAQTLSSQKLAISKPSSLANVVQAGSDTYFRALKSGLIS